jgi:hypothetical protein
MFRKCLTFFDPASAANTIADLTHCGLRHALSVPVYTTMQCDDRAIGNNVFYYSATKPHPQQISFEILV